ncbi:tetratricopeptide repeat protein [Marinigracilibium pacificum]|uniref:Tetratricopeptide repeat protein n=1 Tax=Marinigracilibium pacificum TaxID=2729599 RepID=A0A848J5R2_9BACT|nr:tetratricopeptide repeat protein [Marinigracilibium pacificum]NMM49860.1 tetratricopeptide repeat protein [Marinigracilibium pacificum]
MYFHKVILLSIFITNLFSFVKIYSQNICDEAEINFKNQHLEEALDCANKCLSEYPKNDEVRLLRAQIFEQMNLSDEALLDYAILNQRNTKNPFIFLKAGITAYNNRNIIMANDYFIKAKNITDTMNYNTDILFQLNEQGYVTTVKDQSYLPDAISYYGTLSYFLIGNHDLDTIRNFSQASAFKSASEIDLLVFGNSFSEHDMNQPIFSNIGNEIFGQRINDWLSRSIEANKTGLAMSLIKELSNRGFKMEMYSNELIYLLLTNNLPVPDSIFVDFNSLDNYEKVYNIALLKEKNGELQEAEQIYLSLIEIAPTKLNAIMGRGNIAFKQNRYSDAIEWYSLAISLDQHYDNAYFNRAMSYFSIDEFESGCQDLDYISNNGNKDVDELINKFCD